MQSYLFLFIYLILGTHKASPFLVPSRGTVKISMTKTWAKQNKGFGKPATQSAVKKPTTTTITPTAPGSTTQLTPDAPVASNNDPSFAQLSDSERQDKILAGEQSCCWDKCVFEGIFTYMVC